MAQCCESALDPAEDSQPSGANITIPRALSVEERKSLAKDTKFMSDFKRQKFEADARKHWDLFYKRNQTNFFKDRHWTTREFDELTQFGGNSEQRRVLFEVGCGVGNFFYPLLADGLNFFVHACDLSPRAVQFVKDNEKYDAAQVNAFQCDVTQDNLAESIPADSVDIATLIFVLSALEVDTMLVAIKNIFKVLKPGGMCLLRDYGLYDHAMLRFAPGHKLEENFYVRQDGTRAYYFSLEKMAEIFTAAGYEVVSNEYIYRETINRKEGLCVPRIFVQAKFRRPP